MKDSLNLPQTKFPMKANLQAREPEIIRFWGEHGIYRKMTGKPDCENYILHDGPPYANGNIHIGHALNKILKDMVVKSQALFGKNIRYVPGWDCHGLPIEHMVDKQLGGKRHQISISEKRRLCRQYAQKYVEIQKEDFQRLGVLGDWDNPYLTMSYRYEARIVSELAGCVESGAAYKSKKPVYWCSHCRTALAEAEVEYADHTSPSVLVKFELEPAREGKKSFIVIWTTTPWTLPANLAVCIHPAFEYRFLELKRNGERYLVALELLPALAATLGLTEDDYRVLSLAQAGYPRLEGILYKHPFIDRKSPVITGEHVTLEQGTGCVHTAPGHGADDYSAGRKNGLPVFSPLDDSGSFTEELSAEGDFRKEAGELYRKLIGAQVHRSNQDIIEYLDKTGYLLHSGPVEHSYPHCWRCKKPVIFRATDQWFISLEKTGLRKKALEEINRVSWIPAAGKERIFSMIENRPDWCISRQRSWGAPIIAFKCGDCRESFADAEDIRHIASLMEGEGSDIWFDWPLEKLLRRETACPECGGRSLERETDILDVWFDSGVSHAAALDPEKKLTPEDYPVADLYLEGSDQHRGWFHSSLLESVLTRGKTPYKAVLTHGFVVDGQGRKMSKSMGNVIAPQKIINRYGTEIIRLWVASEDYRGDIRISEEILKRLVDAYRRIRNTFRFFLGNLSDFNPQTDRVKSEDPLDIWMLCHYRQLVEKVRRAYQEFEFHVAFHAIHNFCVVELSSFYLDVLKDRLYVSPVGSRERRASQTVMYEMLTGLVKLAAPVFSFTAEEVWGYLDKEAGESVFLSEFPEIEEVSREELVGEWDRLLELRRVVSKQLELARRDKLIGSSLEAAVTLYIDKEEEPWIKYRNDLARIFIVSEVSLCKEAAPETAEREEGFPAILVTKARGEKCERCWMYHLEIAQYKEKGVCPRCLSILEERE
ncbi:MAG: isoleucine--tRNA ligase [bacterium]